LNSTATIKETQEFKDATHRCKDAIEYCQGLIRAGMKVVAELELTEEKKKLKEYFCTVTSLLAEAFIKNDPNTPNDTKSIQTLVYCTADKEYRKLMNEEEHNRIAANATRSSQDDEEENTSDVTITSKLFKFSGFKYIMTRPNDLEGFHNQFHYHTNGIGEDPPLPGSANNDDYDLIGHLIRDFTATLYALFYTSRITYMNAIEGLQSDFHIRSVPNHSLAS